MSHTTQHKSPTAWIPVARNIKKYACLTTRPDSTEIPNVVCSNHRTLNGMLKCRKADCAGAILKNGEVIRITVNYLSASNGERAALPFATTEEGYNAAMRSDKTWTSMT